MPFLLSIAIKHFHSFLPLLLSDHGLVEAENAKGEFSSPQLSRHAPACVAVASRHRNRSGLLATCKTTRGVAALDVRASAGRVLLLCQCTVREPRRGVLLNRTSAHGLPN